MAIARLALLPALLLAGTAAAQSYSDPGLGVGAHAAYTAGTGAGEPGLTGGVQIRTRLTGGIALEGLITYRTDTLAEGGEPLLKLRELPVQASVLVYPFSRIRVQPYTLLGAGYYYVRAEGTGTYRKDTVTEHKVGLHLGGGVDVRVAKRASLSADLRYVILDVDAVQELATSRDLTLSADFWHATAAFHLYF